MHRHVLCLVVPLLLVCACRGPGLGSPSPRWLRVRTPHFVVHTDLDERAARARAELLERLLAAYLAHGWAHHGELPLHLNVVLFAESGELGEFMCRRDRIGAFGRALFEPWALLSGNGRPETLDVLRHELTHYLAFMAMQDQPRWFAEGLASYFETAFFDDEQGFVIGRAPPQLALLLRQVALLPAEQLLTDAVVEPDAPFYASAWLLVHYLMSEREPAFVRYQQGLQDGRGHRAAWDEAFPDLSVEAVDRALAEYLSNGQIALYARKVPAHTETATVERLARADEYALRGLLYAMSSGSCGELHERRSRESVTQALRLTPHQLEASALRALDGLRDQPQRLASARALSEEHAQSWLAWLTFATIAERERELSTAAEAVARAIALAPSQPHAHMLSAQVAIQTGRPAAALHESEVALRILPNDNLLLQTRARILFAVGACRQLREALATLAAVTHGGLPPHERALHDQLLTTCSERELGATTLQGGRWLRLDEGRSE